jgi:hypothetical protein
MIKKLIFPFALLFFVVFLAQAAVPAEASPPRQVFYQTPTPDAAGRIIHIVREGESCISISLLTQTDINELRLNNNLDADCVIHPGQELILRVVEAPTAVPTPDPTLIAAQPTATPFAAKARICTFLYNDVNGNAISEDSETQIAGGAVSVTDRTGQISLTGTTTGGVDPLCFDDIPEGAYNVSVAPPTGYNPTTLMNYALELRPGDASTLDFGAQQSSAAPLAEVEEPTSPLMGILGAALVLGGIGLGVYLWLGRRPG